MKNKGKAEKIKDKSQSNGKGPDDFLPEDNFRLILEEYNKKFGGFIR